MILTDKINELNAAVEKTQALLNEAKTLQGELIANEISTAKTEIKAEITPEIKSEVREKLENELQSELDSRTSRAVLGEIYQNYVENNAPFLNRVLDLADFKNKVAERIKEEVSIYENTFMRYTNAHSVLAVCLQNELASIAAAMAKVAQIEFYNEALTAGKPAFKIYHEI